jgi:hypothetical protein
MASDRTIQKMLAAIRARYGVDAVHLVGKNVNEFVEHQRLWQFEVQTFGLIDYPESRFCYAWVYREDGIKHIATILHVPRVDSPSRAVRAFLFIERRNSLKLAA